MPSPFDKKKTAPGGTTATAPRTPSPASSDDLPSAASLGGTDVKSSDPYAASDPIGISGYKPMHFAGQLVLMSPQEYGKQTTQVSDGKEQEFCIFDVVPLTVPEEFGFTNRDGDYEPCEPYEIGERLEGIKMFNKPLVREGKSALDKGRNWLLGRIGQGRKTEGRSKPVILFAATEEDKAYYANWLANR